MKEFSILNKPRLVIMLLLMICCLPGCNSNSSDSGTAPKSNVAPDPPTYLPPNPNQMRPHLGPPAGGSGAPAKGSVSAPP